MKANSKTIRRMKVNVGLRKVNRNTHTFETTFQNWKENGEDVALLMPEFSAKWLPIAEESGSWSGWVLLGEIFPLISSELAGMALMPETERLIGEWLSLSSSPLNLKHPELLKIQSFARR